MTVAQLQVLIVEDNKVTADALAELLRGWHCRVQVAHHPLAIELGQEFKPDVVLLDLSLPQIDGITLAHHLRDHEACKGAMIVAMTGYDDALYRLMAQEAGIDHYLVKPIDTDALETLLKLKRR